MVITEENIKDAISRTRSMSGAARYLKVSRDKFKKLALKYGLFEPNQSGKGICKGRKFKCKEDVFCKTMVPSTVLKKWLSKERSWCCEKCGLDSWMGEELSLEIHHLDGDKANNELSNLQILCPNCHSQTHNWRSRNINKLKISDHDMLNALYNSDSIYDALNTLGLSGGGNYKRVYKLLDEKK